ncbi:GRIP1-associated protein 1 [Lingula anatina]|uniref:GRIP1-associated protein 1 n=1 Tax=Lingula anatina TaxID=7574 RepID=A0A1S3H823_LINAN|nr:GRIP1-associated protein 1 [Lingula anatina]|eukprot:XP_013382148.1 GRIP1-associated protein 1 [Lingula anatina]
MASKPEGLTDDEFHRMQLQLIELRTTNYTLEDQCKRKDRELQELKTRVAELDKDLQKANKAISKSKKAKEVELLVQENDILQGKLHSQEEDFRLQNTTLMQELGMLVSTNEKLEKELQSLQGNEAEKEKCVKSEEVSGEVLELQNEIRRLQAQNAALQKNLISDQEKYKKEISDLKQLTCQRSMQDVDLGDLGDLGTVNNTHDSCDGSVEAAIGGDTAASPTNPPDVLPQKSAPSVDVESHKLEEYIQENSSLRLSLDTEKEENNMLKQQLEELEKSRLDQVNSLQEEVDKMQEKLKKKQESFCKLQEEKEVHFRETSQKIDELQASKERDNKYFRDHIAKLKEELEKMKEVLEEQKSQSSQTITELQETVSSLQSQVNSSSEEQLHQLEAQTSKFQQEISELQKSITALQQEKEDVCKQLEESQKEKETLGQKLSDTETERDTQNQALQEASKIAEKRKQLLDELAIKYQAESEKHREEVGRLQDSHQVELSQLATQLTEEKTKVSQLEKLKPEVEQLREQVQSLDNTKGWLERRLQEVEEELDATKVNYESQLETSSHEHANTVESLRQSQAAIQQELEDKIQTLTEEQQEQNISIDNLKQQIKDKEEEMRIHEKKGASTLKDFKRQLHAERKRGEKLQERLQKLVSESKGGRQAAEELLMGKDPESRHKGDNGSISSWSGISGNKDTLSNSNYSASQSPDEGSVSSPMSLTQENNDLLCRVAELQQQNWNLQEQVNMLESSNAAMAEDLIQKTAVIDHYVKEGRPEYVHTPKDEKLTLNRVVDFVKNKGDENLKETNRKLQRMVEETLTKNMHLQEDIEKLSQELHRVQQQQPEATSTPLPSPCKKTDQ